MPKAENEPLGRYWEGNLDARGKRFALIASRFNGYVVDHLINGARETLERLGAAPKDITLIRVPGAFEIPPVAHRISRSGQFDAVICLGAVIRGETPHFDFVAGESSRGVAQAAQEAPIPVIYGILTTDSVEQAVDRAGAKAGNKGADAAMAATAMSNLFQMLPPGGPSQRKP